MFLISKIQKYNKIYIYIYIYLFIYLYYQKKVFENRKQKLLPNITLTSRVGFEVHKAI